MALLLQDPLDTDDIEAREKAATQLHHRGESALPEIRRRIAEAVDPEIRARLKEVVGRIETDVRRRAFGGGKEVAGLRARLVRIDEPLDGRLPYRLEIMNVGAVSRPWLPLLKLDLSLRERFSGHSGAHGRLILMRLSDEGFGGKGDYTSGEPPQGSIVRLRPGETRCIDGLFEERLAPGIYEATVTYYAQKLLGAPEDLVTDTRRFEIKD